MWPWEGTWQSLGLPTQQCLNLQKEGLWQTSQFTLLNWTHRCLRDAVQMDLACALVSIGAVLILFCFIFLHAEYRIGSDQLGCNSNYSHLLPWASYFSSPCFDLLASIKRRMMHPPQKRSHLIHATTLYEIIRMLIHI